MPIGPTVPGPQAADLAYGSPLAVFLSADAISSSAGISLNSRTRDPTASPRSAISCVKARRSADAGDDGRGAHESAASLLAPQQPPLFHVAQGMAYGNSADTEHFAEIGLVW